VVISWALAELDRLVLSEEEFNAARKRLLGQQAPPAPARSSISGNANDGSWVTQTVTHRPQSPFQSQIRTVFKTGRRM
jgi:hypothetical protein